MKIVYYSDAKIPSKEANSVHIMKMCQAFAKNGNEVILLAPNVNLLECDDIYKFYGVENCFKVIKLKQLNIKGGAYLYALRAALYIHKIKPDIAYGRSINICYFLSLISNVRFSLELHQPIESLGKYQVSFFYHISKSKHLVKLVVISTALKEHLSLKNKIDKNKIIVAHDGADMPKEETYDITLNTIGNERLKVGYIGQLYPGKGMEIIAQLIQKMPNTDFHIIGGNDSDISYWKKVVGNVNNAFFYGFVPHNETVAYGKQMDILLAPYLNKVYGASSKNSRKENLANWMSPLKLFEYMSLGKPIICSDLPVLREILTNNETAFLCNCNNIEEWIEKIQFCKNNPTIANKIGQNGKNLFNEKYTWNKRAEKIIFELFN